MIRLIAAKSINNMLLSSHISRHAVPAQGCGWFLILVVKQAAKYKVVKGIFSSEAARKHEVQAGT